MRLIGLTGGIGSGKSTVASFFREFGATIIDADQLAREAVAPGTDGLEKIVQRFGPTVLRRDGALDRELLGSLVFGDEHARKDLNSIVHPKVAELAATRIAQEREKGTALVVYDVPLLYESGLENRFEAVVVVNASTAVRQTRIRRRDQLSDTEIEARMGAQMPLAEKVARADHVIDNNEDLESTRRQVEELVLRLTEEN